MANSRASKDLVCCSAIVMVIALMIALIPIGLMIKWVIWRDQRHDMDCTTQHAIIFATNYTGDYRYIAMTKVSYPWQGSTHHVYFYNMDNGANKRWETHATFPYYRTTTLSRALSSHNYMSEMTKDKVKPDECSVAPDNMPNNRICWDSCSWRDQEWALGLGIPMLIILSGTIIGFISCMGDSLCGCCQDC